MTTDFWWNPAGLNTAIGSGFKASVAEAGALAKALNPAPHHIGIRVLTAGTTATVSGTGALAPMFEKGTKPHVESPKNAQAMSGGLSHPVKGEIRNPGMKAKPFLHPAAAAWPELFHVSARITLAASGFR